MSTKILSTLIALFLSGALIFLVLLRFLPRGPITVLLALAIVYFVFRLVFNMPGTWLKPLVIVIGLGCVAVLIIYLLALSGSSLVFQSPEKEIFRPQYDDPVSTELFDAFQKGKVERLKTVLQAHPDQVHNKQLLKDILYDVYYNDQASARHLASVQYILESGAKIDTSLSFYFIQMAYTAKADMTALLLQHGADPNWTEEQIQMPVLLNTIEGYDKEGKVIEILIKHGADPNVKFYEERLQDTITPLSYAAYLEKWPICKVLLENGAELSHKNKEGVSVKEQILQKAESGQGAYQDPDLARLVKQIKALGR